MTLYLLINEQPCRVEISAAVGGEAPRFHFMRGDDPPVAVAADAITLEPGIISILIGGLSYEARLEVSPQGTSVLLNGKRYEFSHFDPRSLQARRSSGGADDGPRTLKSPMPGRVLRILVPAGSPVKAQQGILVVEAMKMQNELKSPKEGTVARILVAEGDTVTAGQALATVT